MIIHESQTFSKENLRKVQGNQEKRQNYGNLREPQAQAETGLIPRLVARLYRLRLMP